ncbi:3'-5' exonuclease [Aquibacillus sp. 3ASR75-11]|uniref:3'-5' exonuclease n=1 Tax=Terrihalobacillus insolitus TaxID=2950438 RepID=A0A9X3WRS6_9BACI|nr:3'-5' exonuclease [Terrihalobacillus insolitus]MDC3414702.1 3'-5' exonuclease [Terrihalobacillus insolitus]MDC3424185.1 3'-5' exonuclease [Terrihalobacillus insolitus]
MNLVSIDFETANRTRESPCAVGIVVVNENIILDEFYSLINPLMNFDSYNTYVHGITENDVIDAPTFDELWPSLHKYLENNIVIAHNASFDMSVLRYTLDRFGLTYPELDYLCSVALSKELWPELRNYKLDNLADFKNISFSHHHALEDAKVVVDLLLKAMEEQHVKNIHGLMDKLNISSGRIFERGYVTPKVKRKKQRQRRKILY